MLAASSNFNKAFLVTIVVDEIINIISDKLEIFAIQREMNFRQSYGKQKFSLKLGTYII